MKTPRWFAGGGRVLLILITTITRGTLTTMAISTTIMLTIQTVGLFLIFFGFLHTQVENQLHLVPIGFANGL